MKALIFIFSVLIIISLVCCDILKNNPANSPYTYNSSVEGYVGFEDGSPDTLIAIVQAYKEGISTIMGETTTDTNGYYFMDKLSSGTYQLNVSAGNYDDFILTNIVLTPYDTTCVDTVCLSVIRKIEIRKIIIDGIIDEGWEPADTSSSTHQSNWSSSNNFDNLYLARDDDSLYIAVSGGFDSGGNTVNIYIDKDYGESTGINDFSNIQGNGYGDHLRKLVTTPENFGADFAYSGWALSSDVGVVTLEEPNAVDQHILDANISLNNSVIEIAIPFTEMYDNGECPVGTKIALIAIIGGGEPYWIADDDIPQQAEEPNCPLSDPFPFMTVFSRQY